MESDDASSHSKDELMRRKRTVKRTPSRWYWVTAMLLLSAAVGAWSWFQHAPKQTDSPSPLQAKSIPLPPITASTYLNTKSGVRYVGTDRCRECHADQHASYLQTAHSQSMSIVNPDREPPDGTFDHSKSGRRYRIYRQNGQLRHRETLLLPDNDELVVGDYSLKYLVGSGHFTRTYLTEDKGFLVESPATWYTSLAAWAMSPGYDEPEHSSFHRSITHDCLFCHSGPLERVGESDERLRIHETAISCERCHGPGSLHAAKWSAADTPHSSAGDDTIVNPRRLTRDLAEAICHQCHLSGEVKVAVRGRQMEDFRPGLPWQDFVLDYRFETANPDMTVVGHTEQMRMSRCYQADQTLTCTSCHDPHLIVAPADKKLHYRQRCLKCHAEPSCRLMPADREKRNGNDCAACHMPQSPTDIPHIAFTHHRIGIHNPVDSNPRPKVADSFIPLIPVLSDSHLMEIDRSRNLGLAYFQYFRDHRGEPAANAFVAPAKQLLIETASDQLLDPAIRVALGELAGIEGDLPQAEQWLKDAMSEPTLFPTERIAAQRALVEIAMRQGRFAEALAWLEALTEQRRDPADWVLLAICHQRLGRVAEAISAFERVIEIDPAPIEPYQALSELYRKQGNKDREAWCRSQLTRLTAPRREARPGPATRSQPEPPLNRD
jgi:hypothetical protein